MRRTVRAAGIRIPVVLAAAAAAAAATALATSASPLPAQQPLSFDALHWRAIGPTRAGRARALSGVPSQPNVFYVGYDNGGVWRSTDYGSTWHPLFDGESTGSIGAIAVAPSNAKVIYVGSGAGIIRPDLATGDGMYRSNDAGATWTHLGLRESQMIAHIDVDRTNPERLFVAVLGHPYGPNEERGIFRSTDGGRTFERVLFVDAYTSGNDVRIDASNPNVVYAALWQQQQSYIEGGSFGGTSGGIYKSIDGGTTWRKLETGLPSVLQANLALAPSDSRIVYAMVAGFPPGATGAPAGFGGGTIGFYRSADAGEHFTLINGAGIQGRAPDMRPLARIGGGDLPTIAVDPTDPQIVYSASVVFWRTADGGETWSAIRGAPGGDDYQKIWINPANRDILLVVTDQGAVISANRGVSWSNWYNQPTAAMYHVSTDNTFVYRVCGGQQDSGSACVDSRSMDGEITFHDWHPVNIQEYGIAAPDPRDPDIVFGSMRSNVSRYDRRTAQTTLVGPGAEQRGTDYGRNVRTMPIAFASDARTLYYTSNVVWKSLDRGHSWTRISPDLARSTWTVPPTAGKYAAGVTPAPSGSITAFSASTRSAGVLWAGTDDGVIQMTADGGAHWTNVTPPAIQPWTRIFNIDAGHFDTRTAYAAANTMRIDDMNPHFWRTHDGGRTWTEIDAGIAPGAVANAIREDPRQPGLLFASTDTQVWVSFDDGDHWQSLRLDMPAISVRDIQIKDDSACLCADLVAGTHGRGFWILDDITPLRQTAAARTAAALRRPYLFTPKVAVRVRFGTNDPTPWAPELPAGESAPPGGIIDYYLPSDVSGAVTIDIVDGAGTVIRSYASTDPVYDPHPATDSAAYNRLCQRTPTAPFCALPLYWPAPPMIVSTRAGHHRISWDLHYAPLTAGEEPAGGDDDATGAVPRRTYPTVNAPWASPGRYTVRLTANGATVSQPLMLRLDPRVRTATAALGRLATLSRALYDDAVATHGAYVAARALAARTTEAVLRARIDSIAPAEARPGRRASRRGGPTPAVTLASASDALIAAAMAMQGADVAPTAAQEAAATRARADARRVLAAWRALAPRQ